MNGDTEVFFEHMGNVVFAHKKDPSQSVEGQFFFHMVFNVAYYILVQRSPGMFPFGIVSFVYHAVYMKEQAVNAERDLRPRPKRSECSSSSRRSIMDCMV